MTPPSNNEIPSELHRRVAIFTIGVAIAAMAAAFVVKYLVTGVVIRDRLGWLMLAVQLILVIAIPLVAIKRNDPNPKP
jgi:hypothetical protein